VVSEGVWLATTGIVLGVFASLALTRALASLLFGVGKIDPVAIAAAPVVLLAAALFGCYVPARRAAKVDPVIAMRND